MLNIIYSKADASSKSGSPVSPRTSPRWCGIQSVWLRIVRTTAMPTSYVCVSDPHNHIDGNHIKSITMPVGK